MALKKQRCEKARGQRGGSAFVKNYTVDWKWHWRKCAVTSQDIVKAQGFCWISYFDILKHLKEKEQVILVYLLMLIDLITVARSFLILHWEES